MENNNKNKSNSYTKFVLMLIFSFVAMYLTMYLNTYAMDHVYFSLTRFYMACMGISTMAIIMFLFMKKMYQNTKKNAAILLGSVILFSTALFLVRAQKPIADVLWMEAMIPHHSIAILTSERANIQDPEVKKLAKGIIETQRREIEQIKTMIQRLKNDKN